MILRLLTILFCGGALLAEQPYLFVFLGGEECPWSEEVRAEVLPSEAFTQKLEREVQILKVESAESRTGTILSHYNVDELPLFVLTTHEGKALAKFSFGAKESAVLADEVLAAWHEYQRVEGELSHLKELSATELQTHYLGAKGAFLEAIQEVILAEGVRRETPFFLVEKYRKLAFSGDKKGKKLRKLLDEREGKNPSIQRELALIDFAIALKKDEGKAFKPLKRYLKKFPQATEHRWEIEMQLARYFFNRENPKEAVSSAKKALLCAPSEAKEGIVESIRYMEGK